MIFIETRNISHKFSNGLYGIRNISLTFSDSELTVISGKNGAGKSVLMRHLNGLLHPTEGNILIEGKEIKNDLYRTRQQVGIVFQEPENQFIGQTVEEDVAFGPENLGLERKKIVTRVADALDAVGLKQLSNRSPHTLSGGEKRRLAIAGVIAMKPKIVILDEPFSNLDYTGVKDVLTQILLLKKTGHGVIVITHELEKVLAHADRLILMEEGTVKADGTPDELFLKIEEYGLRSPRPLYNSPDEMTWLK
jgi:biotin transport system ATP-binding protein